MNNIAIKRDKINFDKDTRDKLNKFAETYKMKVEYYYGYISIFDKLNVHTISPHKIIFSKYGYNLLVLNYDGYHENNTLYIISNKKEPFTIGSMKKYIREYFDEIYKMNCKRNNK